VPVIQSLPTVGSNSSAEYRVSTFATSCRLRLPESCVLLTRRGRVSCETEDNGGWNVRNSRSEFWAEINFNLLCYRVDPSSSKYECKGRRRVIARKWHTRISRIARRARAVASNEVDRNSRRLAGNKLEEIAPLYSRVHRTVLVAREAMHSREMQSTSGARSEGGKYSPRLFPASFPPASLSPGSVDTISYDYHMFVTAYQRTRFPRARVERTGDISSHEEAVPLRKLTHYEKENAWFDLLACFPREFFSRCLRYGVLSWFSLENTWSFSQMSHVCACVLQKLSHSALNVRIQWYQRDINDIQSVLTTWPL